MGECTRALLGDDRDAADAAMRALRSGFMSFLAVDVACCRSCMLQMVRREGHIDSICLRSLASTLQT